MSDSPSGFGRFVSELKRRRVVRVAGGYALVAWLVVQVAVATFPYLRLPDWMVTAVIVLAILGFPVALILAWAFQVTPDGVRRTAAPEPDPGDVGSAPGTSKAGRIAVTGAVAVLALGGGAWWFWGSAPRPLAAGAGATVEQGASVIAVVPFTTSGAGVERLGTGMVDLLSTNLDAVGGIRTVSPRTVLHEWRIWADSTGLALAGAREVARRVGAGSVLLGSIVAVGSNVRLSAELHTIAGETMARARAGGSMERMLALVDSLSIRLLRDVWRSHAPIPDLRVSAITTGSLDAIRAYLDGMRYYRHARWDSAKVAFKRAIERDSTFALALAVLGTTLGWTEGAGAGRAYTEAAARHADQLPPRARQLLRLQRMFASESSGPEAIDSARAFTARYPDDPAGWMLRGEIAFHQRRQLVLPPGEVYEPFDEVLELDPSFVPALIHPITLAVAYADTARLDRYIDLLAAQLPPDRVEPYRRMRAFLTAPRDSAVAAFADVVGGIASGEYNVPGGLNAALAAASLRAPTRAPADALEGLDRVLADLPDDNPSASSFRYGRWMLATAAGRMPDGLTLADAPEGIDSIDVARARLTPVLLGYAPPAAAADELRVLEGVPADDNAHAQSVYVRTFVALRRGDAHAARALIQPMLADTALSEGFRKLLRIMGGWATVVEGDTAAGLRQMRVPGTGDPNALRLQRARLLASQPETRAVAIRRLRYRFTAFAYIPIATLTIGRALEASGDLAGAAKAYSEVLRMWSDAAPAFESRVEAVRRALARVTGEAA